MLSIFDSKAERTCCRYSHMGVLSPDGYTVLYTKAAVYNTVYPQFSGDQSERHANPFIIILYSLVNFVFRQCSSFVTTAQSPGFSRSSQPLQSKFSIVVVESDVSAAPWSWLANEWWCSRSPCLSIFSWFVCRSVFIVFLWNCRFVH